MLYVYKYLIVYLSQTKLIDKYCIWCKALFDYNVSCILLHCKVGALRKAALKAYITG